MTSMSSLQRLVNLLQWNSIMNEFAHRFQWVRYNDIKSACVRFVTSSQSTSIEDESFTYKLYESNDMNSWKTRINDDLLFSQNSRLLRNSLLIVNASIFCFTSRYHQSLQSIRTRRLRRTRKVQIREVWSNVRLRNQYRSASACSRNRSFHHTNLQISFASIEIKILIQDSQQNTHSRNFRKYLLSSSSHLLLSHLSLHVYRICSETFSFNNSLSRYLRFSQWISSQCRSIRRNEIIASKRSLKKRRE